MNRAFKLILGVAAAVIAAIILWAVPSLIGMLMFAILIIAFFDFMKRRRMAVIRNFNSALQTVCHQHGAISKMAIAYSRRGPLSGPCYDYAKRLMQGENPVEAAANSGVPLQLATAVALESTGQSTTSTLSPGIVSVQPSAGDATLTPTYAHLTYLALTMGITCSMVTWMTVFIFPTFTKMFEEFGVTGDTLPHLTATTSLWLFWPIAVLMLAFLVLNFSDVWGTKLQRWIPVMPTAAERKSEALCGLADAMDAGWPIGRALALGHTIAVRRADQDALEAAMRLIEQGLSPSRAIRRCGWINAREEAWLRDASPARTVELLRAIADQSVRDAAANLRWIMLMLFPILTFALGATILICSRSIFMSLVELIYAVS
ncbi:MAG: hypothetical protein MI861_12745 [Pirellulales bacterium]|nr:hypothetical protein [Pirellulales bacterium]